MASGVGQPPVPGGNVQGIEFAITTLAPQILQAGEDLNRRLGIDPRIPGRRPADMLDPRELTDAVVLTVLYRQYFEASRGSQEKADSFLLKAQTYKQDLDDLLDRLVVHWALAPSSQDTTPATTRMSTRLSR